ncbi:MAG: hypothetical protein KatS3mg008_1982 [Acidimicrobiales bacterium]|nr:MAG: hypothetical protein KatS3mg008_1982 [Acidimicrobiales bacterium]
MDSEAAQGVRHARVVDDPAALLERVSGRSRHEPTADRDGPAGPPKSSFRFTLAVGLVCATLGVVAGRWSVDLVGGKVPLDVMLPTEADHRAGTVEGERGSPRSRERDGRDGPGGGEAGREAGGGGADREGDREAGEPEESDGSGPTAGVGRTAGSGLSGEEGGVMAHVSGGVANPGVYSLPEGSRVADLVAAAGGFTAEADSERINLAAVLVDGSYVWIPIRGAEPPQTVPQSGTVGGAEGDEAGLGGGGGGGGLVDLNTASAEELEELPGVGPSTAAAIVETRRRLGGFTTVEDLLQVPGIGEAKLEQIRPLVTV